LKEGLEFTADDVCLRFERQRAGVERPCHVPRVGRGGRGVRGWQHGYCSAGMEAGSPRSGGRVKKPRFCMRSHCCRVAAVMLSPFQAAGTREPFASNPGMVLPGWSLANFFGHSKSLCFAPQSSQEAVTATDPGISVPITLWAWGMFCPLTRGGSFCRGMGGLTGGRAGGGVKGAGVGERGPPDRRRGLPGGARNGDGGAGAGDPPRLLRNLEVVWRFFNCALERPTPRAVVMRSSICKRYAVSGSLQCRVASRRF
jgi:hypothetical protein